MTSFYSSSSAQGDVLSTPYVQDHSLVSYSEAPIIHDNMMTYLNPSSSKTFSEMNGRNEVMFIQTNDDHQLSIVNCERNVHGLSLSLNTQMSNAVQTSIGFRGLNNSSYNTYQYEQAGTANAVSKSKYVKAAQQLLDEMVSVRGTLKVRQEFGVEQNLNEAEPKPVDTKGKTFPSADAKESALSSSQEISSTERHDLQNKLDKLISMLDDVEKRYKQYYHQMQILVSSFDLVAGGGAAKPYTDLALKTISRHFRCLRDAVSGQIEATRKSIGKQDPSQGEVIPRLRYVDQKLRQQRTLLQFGMLRHAWRPQRGLPENAVTILRAWLFEHFLHPYPKDSEKMMLARQTGLTRNQVANWFINARVRLWKPMVEEMYKEEFHLNSKSSQENSSSQDESNTINTNHQISVMTRSTTNPGSIIDSGGFYAQEQNGLMSYQVSLALGLRRVEGDVDQLGTNFRPGVATENANGAGSGVEYSYLDPGNQQQRFGDSNLVNDFVA